MRGKSRRIAIVCLVLLMMMGTAFAARSSTVSLVGKFETGKVDIKINQLTMSDKGEIAAAPEVIQANKDISYIPRITNKKDSCYVRAKIEISTDGQHWDSLSLDHVYGLGEGWVKKGNYIYLQSVLEQGQQTDIFKGIHVPEAWSPEGIDAVSIAITADAVQSKNFVPDFSKMMPWGSVHMETIRSSGGLESRSVVSLVDVTSMECKPGRGIECSTEDLFSEYTHMMPGDSMKKTIEIKNVSDEKVGVYMNIEATGEGLSREMNMRIVSNEQEIYKGSIAAACRGEGLKLADLMKDGVEQVELEMEFPREAGNAYADLEDDVTWTIIAETEEANHVQTGDKRNINLVVHAAALAVIVIASLLFTGRKGRK